MHATKRRAITLLEVLISMFILLIGLMGVAAMIPAGRFEIQQGSQVDHASMVGRQAFRDLKIRGYLNPSNWTDAGGAAIYQPANYLTPFNLATGATVAPAVAIDPIGLCALDSGGNPVFGPKFPRNAAAPCLNRIFPHQQVGTAALADPVFRSADDLIFAPNANKDFAPTQQVVPYGAAGSSIVKRDSKGDYSWLATIVPDSTIQGSPQASTLGSVDPYNHRTTVYTVSVAVFYKRDISGASAIPVEGTVAVQFSGGGISGGEVLLKSIAKPIKPGRWMMLAGTQGAYSYFRWYRVAAADVIDSNGDQAVTLHGPDWSIPATQTTAWLFDDIIAVFEKNMRLELPVF